MLKLKKKKVSRHKIAEQLCETIERLYQIDPAPADGSVDEFIVRFEAQLDRLNAQSPVFARCIEEVG